MLQVYAFWRKIELNSSILTLVLGVVEGDLAAIEAYKSSGGDIARQLTADEVRLLNRPSAFDVGYTLVHLAIRFQRQDMLAILRTEVSVAFWVTIFYMTEMCSFVFIFDVTVIFAETVLKCFKFFPPLEKITAFFGL